MNSDSPIVQPTPVRAGVLLALAAVVSYLVVNELHLDVALRRASFGAKVLALVGVALVLHRASRRIPVRIAIVLLAGSLGVLVFAVRS